jgi:hypothetical protein
LLLPAARRELGGHSLEALQRSASAGAAWQLALLTDGGRYVSTAGSSYLDRLRQPRQCRHQPEHHVHDWDLMHLAWVL